jgi:hypothetical protein
MLDEFAQVTLRSRYFLSAGIRAEATRQDGWVQTLFETAIQMTNKPDPAIETLLDLEELAKKELEFMQGFGEERRFFDPLLEGTLQQKPASQIEGALVLNNWSSAKEDQPYDKALESVIKAFTCPEPSPTPDKDWTLANLLHRLSPWHQALGKSGSWFAMNWAWGLLKPGRPKSGGIQTEEFRKAMAIWGQVILRLRKAGAPLQWVVIAVGDWAMWKPHKRLAGENQGVPPSAYYRRWFAKTGSIPWQASTAVTDDMIDPELVENARKSYDVCLQLSQDRHEVRFMQHPGKWSYLDATRCVPPTKNSRPTVDDQMSNLR